MRESYEKLLPDFLGMMERLLEKNDGGNGYFVGDKVKYQIPCIFFFFFFFFL